MGDMAIVRSPHFYGWKVGELTIRRWSAYGAKKACNCPTGIRSGADFINQNSSVIRLRPTQPNHIWAIDFVHDKLSNGRSYKMLTVLDECTREALCVAVRPRMTTSDVLDALHPLLMKHGKPEFIAAHFRNWLKRVGIQPLLIYPGSPWENGYNERFNGTLRREVLNTEWFHTTKQAQVAINAWLRQYNQIRTHHALAISPPVPETLIEKTKISGTEKWG